METDDNPWNKFLLFTKIPKETHVPSTARLHSFHCSTVLIAFEWAVHDDRIICKHSSTIHTCTHTHKLRQRPPGQKHGHTTGTCGHTHCFQYNAYGAVRFVLGTTSYKNINSTVFTGTQWVYVVTIIFCWRISGKGGEKKWVLWSYNKLKLLHLTHTIRHTKLRSLSKYIRF